MLMGALGALLAVGLVLAARWCTVVYTLPATPKEGAGAVPSPRAAALSYGRGAAIGLVAGVWTGFLVTGPGVRLIMRLLAVTAGDDAQGRITEADEIVGHIDLGGTIGLIVFGGILPGLLSGLLYMVVRRWLPNGVWGGLSYGGLHLATAATRLDPLRPDNPDFGLVGPGWLAVLTFGLLAVVHGMTVASFASRYSQAFAPNPEGPLSRRRIAVPLIGPTLFALVSVVAAAALLAGMVVAVAASRLAPLVAAMRSRTLVLAGRAALALLAVGLAPGAISDLRAIIRMG